MRLSYNYILAQGDAAEKKVETSISQTKQTLEIRWQIFQII